MKIIRLEAENVKRLSAVDITPEGAVVEITGKNGQGKTSVLDALWWGLTGTANIQATPIRRGEEKALIKIDLGEYIVVRTFNAQEDGSFTTALTIKQGGDGGFKASRPQDLLNGLVGALTFDPLGFLDKKPAEQLQDLQRLVPGVDFDSIAFANKTDFDNRRDINRDLARVKAQIGDAPVSEVDEIDIAPLLAKMSAAGETNAEIATKEEQRRAYLVETERLRKEAERLDGAAADLRARLEETETAAEDLRKRIANRETAVQTAAPLANPVDTSALTQEIEAARIHNIAAGAARHRRYLVDEATELETRSQALTEQMEERTKIRDQAIAEAKLPVEGLGLGEDGVLLNELPFEQASDAEQLRVSMAIAAAMNPKLRILRIRDGSLLDDDSMALVAKFAEEQDMQVWIETVASDREGAVVIEDGKVKA